VEVAEDVGEGRPQVTVHLDVRDFQVVLHQLQRPLDHVVQVHGRALRGLLARERQQVAHDAAGPLRLLVDHLEVAPILLRDLLLLEQKLRQTCDRRERIVQLVCHAGDELPDGGQFLTLNQLRLHHLLIRHVFDQDDDALVLRRAGDASRVHAHRTAEALGAGDEGRGVLAAPGRVE